jgi:hypothetical protein
MFTLFTHSFNHYRSLYTVLQTCPMFFSKCSSINLQNIEWHKVFRRCIPFPFGIFKSWISSVSCYSAVSLTHSYTHITRISPQSTTLHINQFGHQKQNNTLRDFKTKLTTIDQIGKVVLTSMNSLQSSAQLVFHQVMCQHPTQLPQWHDLNHQQYSSCS